MELSERSLTWWPPKGADALQAAILVGNDALPTIPVGNGQHRSQLLEDPSFPLIVQIRFGDGRISDPIIVHDETALRIASPGVTDRRLRNSLDRVMRGEEDIIDLALQAHLIFGHAPDERTGVARATGAGKQSSTRSDDRTYSSPEEFRKGVSLKPATGRSGHFIVDDPGLLDLLATILRGVTDVGGREARRRLDEDEDADLEAGENEDGEQATGQELPDHGPPPQNSLREARPKTFTAAQLERRKSQLKKAIAAFEKMLTKISTGPSTITTGLAAQTAFILNLMLYACTKDHPRADGGPVRLMELAPKPNSDRDLVFSVQAGRILQSIWVGGPNGPLIEKLDIGGRHSSLPDDIFFLIVMSRWAIARAYIATIDRPANHGLSKILHAMAVKIYRASSRCGPIDDEAELRFIVKLDEAIGFGDAETKRLVRDCRTFAKTLANQVDTGVAPQSSAGSSPTALRR